jgi:hypothetical protein
MKMTRQITSHGKQNSSLSQLASQHISEGLKPRSEIDCSHWAVLTQNADSLTYASILFSILTASEGISEPLVLKRELLSPENQLR